MALGREALGRSVLGHPTVELSSGAFLIVAEDGAYVLTGQDSSGDQTAFVVDAEVGTYTLTGFDATLAKGIEFDADVGSYALTGQDIGDPPFGLTAEVGSYSLTGQDAGLISARYIEAERGTYTYTAFDTGTVGTLPAEVGTFVLTGIAAPRKTDGLVAEVGSYALTGVDAAFSIGAILEAEFGEYTYEGQDITIELLRAAVGIQANPRLSRPMVTAARAPQPIRIRSNYLRASGQ